MSKESPNPKLELEESLRGLDQEQMTRFQLLFSQRKNNNWLLPAAFTALSVYALAAGMLLHPGYSWMVALIPTLFVVFFIRSLLKGVVTEGRERQKDYGSVILPFVLIALFGLCGVLIWGRNDNIRQHQDYLADYQHCQENPGGTVANTDYFYGYYDGDCDRVLDGNRHRQVIEDYERDNEQLTRGVIVTGLGLFIIYPLSLYYSKSLIDKKNTLLAKTLADKIKQG